MTRKIFTLFTTVFCFSFCFSQTYFNLSGGAYNQNWAPITQITTDNDWTGISNIRGYTDNLAGATTGVDPQTILAPQTTLDVTANSTSTNPGGGGIYESELANPTISLNGSGTADAPSIVLFMNSTGRSAINLSFNIRDLDGSADDAVQQVAVQYRLGATGNFVNIPAGYVADATQGGTATLVTPVNIVLPAACDNQAQLEIRILTTNALGTDELIGIDDIVVTQGFILPITCSVFGASLQNNIIYINWTASCTNSSAHFEVEKSIDGRNFSFLAKVNALGTGDFDYTYNDNIIDNSSTYYRLKLVDVDGKFDYTRIARINRGKASFVVNKIFPTIASSSVTVQLNTEKNLIATVFITDMKGSTVKRQELTVVTGTTGYIVNIAALQAGSYTLTIKTGELTTSARFIKQ